MSTEVSFLPPAPGQLEAGAQHALDLRLGVGQGVHRPPAPAGLPAPARLAEVQPAGQLAHDDHVRPPHDLLFEDGLVQQGRVDSFTGRRLAYRPSPLRRARMPPSGRTAAPRVVPLRPADGAEVDGVRPPGQGQRLAAAGGRPVASMAAPPTERRLRAVAPAEALGDAASTTRPCVDHFGADAVAGQDGDQRGCVSARCSRVIYLPLHSHVRISRAHLAGSAAAAATGRRDGAALLERGDVALRAAW